MKLNTAEVATLQPDFLGFIFYEASPRNFDGEIPELPSAIKKVGVFVDEKIEVVLDLISKHQLNAIQLHGNESPEYCAELKERSNIEIELFKVFSVKDEFDFSRLKPFEDEVDYFLFDTKGKLPGGNGYTFNWNVLKNYPSTKPYILSGGIGLDEIEKLKAFKTSSASKYCYAIDVNSKFEIEPGFKNINEIEKFKHELQH